MGGRARAASGTTKVLVLRPGALGDTLLAVPALRALRRAFPQVRLAGHAPTARLLAALGEVDCGMAFDHPSLGWLFRDSAPTAPFVAWMNPAAAPALKYGLVVAPSRPTDARHCALYLLETLAPLGIDLTWDERPLAVNPMHSGEVLIHAGSGSPAKNWPPAQFAGVIRRLDAPVRLIIGEADHRTVLEVEALVGGPLPHLERPPLEELAQRLAGCRAYLGNDSGVSHLAGLCGARTVALFGPTSPEVWRPLGPDVHALPFEAPPSTVAALLSAAG